MVNVVGMRALGIARSRVCMSASSGRTAGVVVAAHIVRLVATQNTADIDAPAIIQKARMESACVRHIESANTITRTVLSTDFGE